MDHKITGISVQAKNPNRVNVSIDGIYRFSLDMFQVTELGLKVGQEFSEAEIVALEQESSFGKLYARSLEYCLMRPHSAKEMRDYLWRKTRDSKYKTRQGEIKDRVGVSKETSDRVYERLLSKGYINDEKFARFWVENRNQRKGTSFRKLEAELRAKGIDAGVIREAMQKNTRDEKSELDKIIEKKASKYDDKRKLMAHLVRQGFSYDDVKTALEDRTSDD